MSVLSPSSGDRSADIPIDGLPDWELLRAARGGGRWLCAHTARGPIALAAPGVALDAGSGEDLDRWRIAHWRSLDPECEAIDLRAPDEVESLRLSDVVDLAGPEWESWLRGVTEVLIERTFAYGFVGMPGAPVREARARRSQALYELLVAEAEQALPGFRSPAGASPRDRLPRTPGTVNAFLRKANRRGLLTRLWSRLKRRSLSSSAESLQSRADIPDRESLLL